MYVERIIYPVMVLGYGKRITIWMQGCEHHCHNCINPELWQVRPNSNLDCDMIASYIKTICDKNQVDGITSTGGDPFFQIDELYHLLTEISELKKEILVFTGYTIDQISEMKRGKEILDFVDVLIDGKYMEDLNENNCALRGSSNQKIYYKNAVVEERYRSYIKKGRQLQQFYFDNHILSIGIHDRSR